MRIDFSTVLKGIDGSDLKTGDKPATLGSVAVEALLAVYPDEAQLGGEEKANRFKLAVALQAGGEQEVTPEDVVLMKKLIGKAYGPLVVGRAFALLG